MENYSANISASHTEVVLKEGMQVKCIRNYHDLFEVNAWYPVINTGGILCAESRLAFLSLEREDAPKHFDLANPRNPSKIEEKPKVGWLVVEEEPKTRGPFLAYSKNHGYVVAFFEKGYWYDQLNAWLFSPTHYKELPSPPNTTA